MDLITITPHIDHEGKECLKMELTIDGATALVDRQNYNFPSLFDSKSQPTDLEKLRISYYGEYIYTSTEIDWHTCVKQTIKKWHFNGDQDLIITTWETNPKAFFLYYPDTEGNKKRESDITAMIAATNWALHEQQPIDKIAIDINERYNQLTMVKAHIRNGLRMLKSPVYKQDPKYVHQLNIVCVEMQKEADYCFQKADLIYRITNADLRSKDPVSKKYREFRNVDENKNNDKTTIEIHEKQDEETTVDTERQDGSIVSESSNDE